MGGEGRGRRGVFWSAVLTPWLVNLVDNSCTMPGPLTTMPRLPQCCIIYLLRPVGSCHDKQSLSLLCPHLRTAHKHEPQKDTRHCEQSTAENDKACRRPGEATTLSPPTGHDQLTLPRTHPIKAEQKLVLEPSQGSMLARTALGQQGVHLICGGRKGGTVVATAAVSAARCPVGVR